VKGEVQRWNDNHSVNRSERSSKNEIVAQSTVANGTQKFTRSTEVNGAVRWDSLYVAWVARSTVANGTWRFKLNRNPKTKIARSGWTMEGRLAA